MKNKFIKSTIILVLGGGITKLLAMVIKIFLTRSIGEDGTILYMSILPTFNLFITFSTLSLSTGIAKLIAEGKNGKKTILSIMPISLIYNFILMFILIILSPFISKVLLKNVNTYYPIMAISFTLPFICLSNILKGYFFGRERMIPYVISNVFEQIIRLLFIIFITPKIIKYGTTFVVSTIVLINIFSELASSVCLILNISDKRINFSYFKFDKNVFKDILNISLPATGSRLIGSISYFLEPIILTFVMSRCGYSIDDIAQKYGIITGYVFPLLLIPSFFTAAISNSLLPIISNNYTRGNYEYSKKKLRQAVNLSLTLGIVFTITFMFYSKSLLMLIFNTKLGNNYIKIIAPCFLLHYIQGPLTSYLQGINKANLAMRGTLVGAIIKNICLLILPRYIGIWGFIISSIINIFYVTMQHIYYIRKFS